MKWLRLCFVGMLGWATVAQSAPIHIKVDLDSNRTSSTNAGVPPLNTQGGYTSWDVTNLGTAAGSNVTVIDGITLELFGFSSANQSRGRAEEPQTPWRSLTRDFIFNEGASGRAVALRLTGLDLGKYRLHSWHWDSVVTTSENFIQVEVRGAGVGGVTTILDDMQPFSRSPLDNMFTKTAEGVVELIFREDDAATATDPVDGNRARLNGFIIRSVPEPCAIALSAIACIGLFGYGLRKRR